MIRQHENLSTSVIIIDWNSAAHLSRCLACLSIQKHQTFEVIVIDNGSKDKSTIGLKKKYPGLDLRIENLHLNIGFSAANNLGARLAHGQWLALVNADAFPEPDWLENLLHATEENSKYVSFSSRQIQANSPDLLD